MSKSERTGDLNESLLDAWVRTSVSVVNERVVSLLTYKESLVCRELKLAGAVQGGDSQGMTATELCRATRMAKSQMNGILTSLEERGVVSRTRSESDHRRVEVLLDDSPDGLYQRQHTQLIDIVSCIVDKLGTERAWEATDTLNAVADAADAVLSGLPKPAEANPAPTS